MSYHQTDNIDTNVNFKLAQVKSYNNVYLDESQVTKANITVLVKTGDIPHTIENVYPAFVNSKHIPLVGEHVLLFEGFDPQSDFNNRNPRFYYIGPIAMQSNINDNTALINDSDYIQTDDDPFFTKKELVTTKQPYVGDYLLEGRWGNSIRLGSTSKSEDIYTVNPGWSGTSITDPIIIISNNSKQSNRKNQHVVEDVNVDDSLIYLTSKQKINNLTLGSINKPNPLRIFKPNESEFIRPQFIAIADRVILKAKSDIAIIDAEKGIILNTTEKILLGSDDANESMVHGNILLEILQHIILQMKSTIECGVVPGQFKDLTQADKALSKMQRLLSSKYFMKRIPFLTK